MSGDARPRVSSRRLARRRPAASPTRASETPVGFDHRRTSVGAETDPETGAATRDATASATAAPRRVAWTRARLRVLATRRIRRARIRASARARTRERRASLARRSRRRLLLRPFPPNRRRRSRRGCLPRGIGGCRRVDRRLVWRLILRRRRVRRCGRRVGRPCPRIQTRCTRGRCARTWRGCRRRARSRPGLRPPSGRRSRARRARSRRRRRPGTRAAARSSGGKGGGDVSAGGRRGRERGRGGETSEGGSSRRDAHLIRVSREVRGRVPDLAAPRAAAVEDARHRPRATRKSRRFGPGGRDVERRRRRDPRRSRARTLAAEDRTRRRSVKPAPRPARVYVSASRRAGTPPHSTHTGTTRRSRRSLLKNDLSALRAN